MPAHILVTGADGKTTTVEVTGKQIMDEWFERQAKLKPHFDNLERIRAECMHYYPTYASDAGIELCCGCNRPRSFSTMQCTGQLEFDYTTENGNGKA